MEIHMFPIKYFCKTQKLKNVAKFVTFKMPIKYRAIYQH